MVVEQRDHFEGTNGPSLHTVLGFPPLFDHVSVVLAWPEIGFPETVVDLSLPDRATVERNTVSIWDAPLNVRGAPTSLNHRVGAFPFEELAVRLTAVGEALSMEILSVANEEQAQAVAATVFPSSRRPPSIPDDPEHMRARGPGASVAIVHDRDAVWVRPHGDSSSAGSRAFRSTAEFALNKPDDGVLALMVAWPAAGLPDVCVEIPLSGD